MAGVAGRLAVVVGRTFLDVFSPYLAARVFGGPVFWTARGNGEVGTDWYHYQFALGFVVTLPAGLDVYAECAPLGERRCAGGAGVSF